MRNDAVRTGRIRLAGVIGSGVLGASAAGAVVLSSYVGPNGGGWNTAANWDPVGVPNNGANTFFVTIPNPVEVHVNLPATISGLTLVPDATVRIDPMRILTLTGGTIANDGTLWIDSGAATTLLRIQDDVELAGSGALSMTGTMALVDTIIPRTRLTNGASHAIQGRGALGSTFNDFLRVTNHGLIEAVGGALAFNLGGSDELLENSNDGVIRAATGGISLVNAGVDNTGGLIEAMPGQVVTITDGRVRGGVIDVSNGVSLSATGLVPLEDVSLKGLVRLIGGSVGELRNSIELNGTYRLDGGAALCILNVVTPSFSGNGVIQGNGSNGRLLSATPDVPFTLPASWTIRGQMRLGSDAGGIGIENLGIIEATTAPGPLTVFPSSTVGAFENKSIMRAVGNDLIVSGGRCGNSIGTIEAQPGRVVRLRNGIVDGGLIRALGTGQIVFDEFGAGRLANLTLDGTATQTNGRSLEIEGFIEHRGAFTIQGTSLLTPLIVIGATTFGGDGTLLLAGANAQLRGTSASSLLTNGEAHTIRGEGQLGANMNLSIVNDGTIVADRPTPLVIDVTGSFQNTSTGVLRAAPSRTITAPPGGFANAGLVSIEHAALLDRTGNLTQSAGSTIVEGTLRITFGSFLLNGGTILGGGVIDGTVSASRGVLSPDGLEISGALSMQPPTKLEVSVGASPDSVPLAVGGTATLSGTLSVSLEEGFEPVDGEPLTVLTASQVVGAFSGLSAAGVGCLEMETIVSPTTVEVVFHDPSTGILGDVNWDRVVGSADVIFVLESWGRCTSDCCPADIDGDGDVDGRDLSVVLGQWRRRVDPDPRG